ncbi:hypothetical protein L3081_05655 [Colwellia sp. MSW7]|jgi:hypothetical protein|uniref:Uncharacterized protein n=1 Tax=Colwellia maritima TaxID=2912588 RepID=A0ABS9WYA2_9GAMM|nr:hypothetical protein [Colwellia maritima]MCI2282974.1 hypothetical protein [Colwellia maritima]
MKKWLFSNDGEITESLTFDEAQNYIKKHAESSLYVWHPTYTYWRPLYEVEDFQLDINIPPPPVAIPKTLLEEYKNKEEALFKILARVDNTLGNTRSVISEMDHDIDMYFTFTEELNTEVKETLEKVSEQYAALQKSIRTSPKSKLVYR